MTDLTTTPTESTLPSWIDLESFAPRELLDRCATSAQEVEQWLAAGRGVLDRAHEAYSEFVNAIPSPASVDGFFDLVTDNVVEYKALEIALMRACNATLDAIDEDDHFHGIADADARAWARAKGYSDEHINKVLGPAPGN